jgi:hypothetical protein
MVFVLIRTERRDMEIMTDRQYDGILQMIEMIVESCKDLDEAKRKIAALRREKQEKEKGE